MKDKRTRQRFLMRLTRRQPFSTQDEMVEKLRESGFPSTQSSISRDVRELGLVRLNGRYVPAVDAGGTTDLLPVHDSELIIACEPVGANLIVVRTPPGAASAVAIDLDRKQLSDIAGTVAGDDTIFVAVRSRAAQGRVLAVLPNVTGPPSVTGEGRNGVPAQ